MKHNSLTNSSDSGIDSESKFIWHLLVSIIMLPFKLFLIPFKKAKFSDLSKPFILIKEFIVSAKFTFWIIVINIVVFIVSLFFSKEFFLSLALRPQNLINFQFYTFITSAFLHASISHLLGNMLGILLFGRILERKLGSLKTALIYFGAMIIASIFSCVINLYLGIDVPGIGASGALMGLISAAMLINPLYITFELLIPIPVMMAGLVFIYADIEGIISQSADGIGHFVHLGGFISIAILGFVFGIADRKKLLFGLMINIVSAIVFFLLFFRPF